MKHIKIKNLVFTDYINLKLQWEEIQKGFKPFFNPFCQARS